MQNTVLVVDDMEINRDILTEILGGEYNVCLLDKSDAADE